MKEYTHNELLDMVANNYHIVEVKHEDQLGKCINCMLTEIPCSWVFCAECDPICTG